MSSYPWAAGYVDDGDRPSSIEFSPRRSVVPASGPAVTCSRLG